MSTPPQVSQFRFMGDPERVEVGEPGRGARTGLEGRAPERETEKKSDRRQFEEEQRPSTSAL